MTLEGAFLEEIRERPDDDAPRLIYADWLEENGDPDRAEFIRLQISTWRKAGQGEGMLRAGELLVRNWERWVIPLSRLAGDGAHEPWLRGKPMGQSQSCFERGFVTTLTLDLRQFLANAEAIVRIAPLTSLRLHGAGGHGTKLASCDTLRWIRELNFIDYFRAPLGPEDAAALAASPYLERLAILGLYRNNLGDEGASALAAAPWLSGVIYLDLTENGLSMPGLRALTARGDLHSLRSLCLAHNAFDDGAVSLLLEAPWLGQLSLLSLRNCGISPVAADELRAAAPRLRLAVD